MTSSERSLAILQRLVDGNWFDPHLLDDLKADEPLVWPTDPWGRPPSEESHYTDDDNRDAAEHAEKENEHGR